METPNDSFESLRKLLALKKHEQPPPGYFTNFSSKIIARLEAAARLKSPTWRQRLGLDFDYKPAMMGIAGVVVCGLLLTAVITSLSQASVSPGPLAADPGLFSATGPNVAYAADLALKPIVKPEDIPSSTVPLAGTANSPFGQFTPHA